ncbi:MAG TPA: VWA domain-containing protein [Cytophagaceae bacterium]|nr:VWA domain-containing protein [Cytophagaceae bacterium]
MNNGFKNGRPLHRLICILTMWLPLPLLAQTSANNAAGNYSPNDTVVKLKTALDNIYLCPNKKSVYLYLDLKGCSLGKRIPLNISVVFDRSHSMKGERIHFGKIALEYLIDHLDSTDNMSIVLYDHLAEVLHGSEPIRNKEELKKKLHHIHPRGATNISAGLDLGFTEVKSTYNSTKINKVFLMSDGIPNEGITDFYLLERMVKLYSSKNNITLTSFGLGHEFDEVLMHDLAEAGGGHYYYIENAEDASKELGMEVKTLLSVVAKNVSLSIEFPSDYLELTNVNGQHHTLVNGMVVIDLNEVHPNETNGILLKFNVLKKLDTPVLFNTSLVYENMITNTKMIQKRMNVLSPQYNLDTCDKTTSEAVLEKIIYFSSNDLLESAIVDAENNDIVSAKNKLKKGKGIISNDGKGAQSALLTKQYKTIDDYDKHWDDFHNKSEHEIKKIHKKTRHQNYKHRKMKDS